MACAGHTNTYYTRFNDFAGVEARVCDDGTVQANVSIHDHGCGTVTAFKMILAEGLDIPQELIRMKEADTAHTPYDYGCFSSRSTFVVGRAVQCCGENLVKEILACAAKMLDAPVEKLYVKEGAVHCTDREDVALGYKEISQWAILNLRRELFADARYHNVTNPTVTGTHFAHVEVDTWTGLTRMLDYLAVHDVGQAINPAMCIAQTQGAVQMGCGAALREQMTRHLLARLNEYEPEGMTARPDGPGTVLAQIGQMSGEQAVRALADQGVQALAAGERVRFLIGSEVCFEDLDYVQAAAAALLE